MSQIAILTTPARTGQWAAEVAKAADSDRHSLGFIPKPKYIAACEAGRIFVAISELRPTEIEYAGHIMFGGAGSELHIQQLFVSKKYRKHGVARKLLDALVTWAEGRNYLGLAIRVAADLKSSNQAWERLGFALVKKVRGRRLSKRFINLRHRELRSQSLLQFVQAVGRDKIVFSVPPNVGRGVPTYVVDLNVYFDCLKERGRRPAAQALFRAAFSTLFRLFTTSEFPKELERHAPKDRSKPDPILEFARALPTLSYEAGPEDLGLADELAKKFFPDRVRAGTQTERDRSDVSHMVVAIRTRATGFITSERALLLQRDWTRERYGTDIIPVEEIADYLKDAKPSVQGRLTSGNKEVTFSVFDSIDRDTPEILELCDRTKASGSIRHRLNAWLRGVGARRIIVARASTGLIAALGWQLVNGPPRQVESVLVADSDSDAASAAVDFMTESMIHAASAPSVARIDLQSSEIANSVQQVLLDHGFTKGNSADWTKIAIGRHVDSSQWPRLTHDIKSLCGLALPSNLMAEKFAYAKTIRCMMDDGRSWIGSLDDLEGLLSPVALVFSDRAATVVPIRAAFSEGLFGHLRQGSLFGQPMASFRRERMYYTASHSFRLFERGRLLLFYESAPGNGRTAIIAAARCLGARTILKSELQALTLSRGVLDQRELQGLGVRPTVTAVSFDNVLLLPRPVTLEEMRAHNWVPSTNFVTATRMASDAARQILDLGQRA